MAVLQLGASQIHWKLKTNETYHEGTVNTRINHEVNNPRQGKSLD